MQEYYSLSNLSWLSLVLLILPFLLFTILHFITHRKSSSSLKLPPGPGPLPIIGDLHRLGRFPYRTLQKMSSKYGDIIYLKLGHVPTIVFSSRELAESVTKAHDLDFCSRPQRVSFKMLTYNFLDVAFSPYSDSWRHIRRLYIVELLSSKRVEMGRSIREEKVAKMMNQIAEMASASPGRSINLSGMMAVLVQDVIYGIVLGKSWSTGAKERKRIIAAVEEQNALSGYFCAADYLPWARWFDVLSGYNKRLEKSFSSVDKFLVEVIEERVANRTGKEEVEEDQEDFVDVLLRLEKSCSLTRDHVKANLSILFLAAIDTNFTTITWAMCELMRNKRVMFMAQEEVRRVCGSKGKVEESDKEKLPYLRAVVKETLRLHNPTPFLLPRESMRQTTIDGYDIPEKSLILINMYSISRDPRYWESPLEFMPERFLDNSIGYNGQHFEYLPFGAGRRICPGMQYAVTIVELALANLLYAFDWELPAGMVADDLDMSEKTGIVVGKKTPLLVVPKIAAP